MKFRIALSIIIVVGLPFLSAASSHDPIIITDDSEFTARNGVRNGQGTENDPYILADWEINITSGSSYGIRVEHVNAYFVLRNITIRNKQATEKAAIQFTSTSNGRIEDCNIAYSTNGISLYSSSNNVITNNRIENNQDAGISLQLSSRNAVTGNDIVANTNGIYILASNDNVIEGNYLIANHAAVTLDDGSSQNRLAKNIVYHKNTNYGFAVREASYNTVVSNSLVEAETGILLDDQADGNFVFYNTIVDTVYGLSISGSQNEIRGNLIALNYAGVVFPHIAGKHIASGNAITRNTFTENSQHVHISSSAVDNRLFANNLLGKAQLLVIDLGINEWSVSGRGNFWQDYPVIGGDDNGMADSAVTVPSAGVVDSHPLAAPVSNAQGVVSAMKQDVLSIRIANGDMYSVPAHIADEPYERFTGFRGFPPSMLEGQPGILFVYDNETEGRFTMKTVDFPLDIAFFRTTGELIGSLRMRPHSDQLYSARSPYQYALEIPQGSPLESALSRGAQLIIKGSLDVSD